MKAIQVDRDVFNYLSVKSAPTGESLALTLRRELRVPEPTETIEIDDDTYQFILARSVDIGESPSDILRRELRLDQTPPRPQPGPIVFRIPAGTGAGPWNTSDRTIEAAVGDTLRIVNDDTVPHRLHTDGAPFRHPNDDIAPGASADFILQTPFRGKPLHDHNGGLGSEFWIAVT